MNNKKRKRIISSVISIAIMLCAIILFMNPFKNDQPFSIIDVMEDELALQTDEVTAIGLKRATSDSKSIKLKDTDIDDVITYLDSTIIEKSKTYIQNVDGAVYMLILYTDEHAIDYGSSKRLLLKNNSGKTYIQLIETDKSLTYETDDNGLYNLVIEYLK